MAVLVVDIGGTYIKYAWMTREGEIIDRGKIPTPQSGREALTNALGDLYDSGDQGKEGIAIAMPGIVDADNGYCSMGGALRYNDDFYIRQAIQDRCPVPVSIENDAKCAAMAEAELGALKDVSDGFVVILGTMIGGAFIKDHKLHRGKHFSAGEVSYIDTVRDGLPTVPDVWGNRCGTTGLCARYAELKGMNPSEVDGVIVFEALEKGDPDAEKALDQFTRELAVQIFNIQMILDPERFAIGGGISARPELLDAIRRQLDILYTACPYHVTKSEVVACKFLNDANLYGALQCYIQRC